MSITFNQVCDQLRSHEFYRIAHPVVVHHLRKEFSDFDVMNDMFYILPVGRDYLHVAVVELDTGEDEFRVQVKFTCAGDDLLYGLRTRFKSGGSENPITDLGALYALIENGNLRLHPLYVRKRFRHGRFQAKFRALLIYLRDRWQYLLPKRLPNE